MGKQVSQARAHRPWAQPLRLEQELRWQHTHRRTSPPCAIFCFVPCLCFLAQQNPSQLKGHQQVSSAARDRILSRDSRKAKDAPSSPPSSFSQHSLGKLGTIHGCLQHGFSSWTIADVSTLHGDAKLCSQLYMFSLCISSLKFLALKEGSFKSTLTFQFGSNPCLPTPHLRRTQCTSAIS